MFSKALKKLTIAEQEPTLLEAERMLSTCQPFPWSRPVWDGVKTVFNLVPCDNYFERDFAKSWTMRQTGQFCGIGRGDRI